MAPRPSNRDRKAQLVAVLATFRHSLQEDRLRIRRQVNPIRRLGSAVRNKPVHVFAATAGVAFLFSLLIRRRPRHSEKKRRGATHWIMGGVIALAKPAARIWLTNLVRSHSPALFQIPDSDHTP